MTIKFAVKTRSRDPGVAEVRYDCTCGCHPIAKYRMDSVEAGHQHCCCGIVHFAGPGSDGQLRAYLAERRSDGRDAPDMEYAVEHASVESPWGGKIEVTYATPVRQG